jgi:small subunit ribosomal protein S10
LEANLKVSGELDILKLDTLPTPEKAERVARLSLEGFMEDHLDFFSYFAKYSATALQMPTGNIEKPQPDIKRIRINKSPFVHGKSREVYDYKTYRYSIDVFNADEEVVERWIYYLKEHAPPGIRLIVDKWETREIGYGKEMLDKAQAVLKARDSRRGIPEASDN